MRTNELREGVQDLGAADVDFAVTSPIQFLLISIPAITLGIPGFPRSLATFRAP
jgi:hypothetical protein